MNASSTLLSFAKVYENIIPDEVCDKLVSGFKKLSYETHQWSSYSASQDSVSPSTEFLRAEIDPKNYIIYNPYMKKAMDRYYDDIGENLYLGRFSQPMVNKYDSGTQMLSHYDHIYSLFNGTKKGIPVLSILGLLNDDFVGGEFVFWDDYIVPLKKGSIIIFPSLFLYPHKVNMVTTGERYSVVSWAF
jgi:hypothetical protein